MEYNTRSKLATVKNSIKNVYMKLKCQANATLCNLQFTFKVQSVRNLDSHRTSELGMGGEKHSFLSNYRFSRTK